MGAIKTISPEVLKAHYEKLPKEYGFAGKCAMTLLGDLTGKCVLDINCRRGKGVLKLSECVGSQGHVVGVDPTPEWIEIARSQKGEVRSGHGLSENNTEYLVAYPEDLAAAGLTDETFDVVFANSSVNLAFCFEAVLRETFRVLVPGGVLVYDGVVVSSKRDAVTVGRARALGNAVQAALFREDFEAMMERIGFEQPIYHEESEIRPEAGYKDDFEVPVAQTSEDVRFTKTTVHLTKPCR